MLAGATKGELSGLLGGPELPREITGTKEDMANVATLGAFLERVATYWRGKAGSASSMSDRDVARLISLLRPEFEMVRPLALSRDRAAQDLLKLTEEQYEVLDHWAGADRVLCSSPAGCGKTLLAVEILRRVASGGVNCLFVSGTQQLAEVVRNGSDVAPRVLSIQELEAMPLAGRPVADVVVVDEGQQLLTSSRMTILDDVIAGGIKNGRWAWFGDPNYQLPGNRDAQGFLEVLQAAASVQPRLRRNCRNTPEIVTMAELASGIVIGHAAAKGRGATPVIQDVDEPSDMANAIGATGPRMVVAGHPARGDLLARGRRGCGPASLGRPRARGGSMSWPMGGAWGRARGRLRLRGNFQGPGVSIYYSLHRTL